MSEKETRRRPYPSTAGIKWKLTEMISQELIQDNTVIKGQVKQSQGTRPPGTCTTQRSNPGPCPCPASLSCYPPTFIKHTLKAVSQESNIFAQILGAMPLPLGRSRTHRASDPRSIWARGKGAPRPRWTRTYLSLSLCGHLVFLMHPSFSCSQIYQNTYFNQFIKAIIESIFESIFETIYTFSLARFHGP